MSVWIIEPHAPLIVRDGRSFGATPGARAESLKFPFPSTTTGAVRTRDGTDADGYFEPGMANCVKEIGVRGPFLVELASETGDISDWLIPAPSDALLLDTEPSTPGKAVLKQLVPLKLPPDVMTNFPADSAADHLLVGLPRPDRRKPSSSAPRYWKWKQFEKWQSASGEAEVDLLEIGHNGPVAETPRVHVAIQSSTKTAEEHALFQTRGLEFTREHDVNRTRLRLALAVETDATNLRPGLATLGGERRLVNWRRSQCALPSCPDDLRNMIVKHRCCRLVLITPAYFQRGWNPSWLINGQKGVKPELRAIAIGKPQVVSGWDLESRMPKPTRRLAPAGTVMFFNLGGSEAAAIGNWVEAMWMSCVSDEEQDRRDGFGLAVLGVWDGIPKEMEV